MSVLRTELPAIRIRRGPGIAAAARLTARLLVVAGVLVFGFVAYQFGVTTFLANRAQPELIERIADRTAAVSAVPYRPVERPQAPILVPDDLAMPPLPDMPTPVEEGVAAPPEPALPPVILTEPEALSGDAVGRIIIPKAAVDWAFVEGVGRSALRSGAGHMPDTPLPGQPGNAVISGHRTTYGAPFLHLDRLEAGDLVTVETATGTHTYQVVETLVVKPRDTWVTGQWDGSWLTLTTCNPVFSSRERLVVVSRLVAGPNAEVILGG